jgi:hypothetical protein
MPRIKTKMKQQFHHDIHERSEDDEDEDDHVRMSEIDHYDKGEHDSMSEDYSDSDQAHHMRRSRHAFEPPGPNVHEVSVPEEKRERRQKLAIIMIGKKMGSHRGRL